MSRLHGLGLGRGLVPRNPPRTPRYTCDFPTGPPHDFHVPLETRIPSFECRTSERSPYLSAILDYKLNQDGTGKYENWSVRVEQLDETPGLLTGHKIARLHRYEKLVPVMLVDEPSMRSLILDIGLPLSDYLSKITPPTLFDVVKIKTNDDFVAPAPNHTEPNYTESSFLSPFWKSILREILDMINYFHGEEIVVGPIGMENLVMFEGKLRFKNLLLERIPKERLKIDVKGVGSKGSVDPRPIRKKYKSDYAHLGDFITRHVLEGKENKDPNFQRLVRLLDGTEGWPNDAKQFSCRVHNIQNHVALMSWVELETFYRRCFDVRKLCADEEIEYWKALTSWKNSRAYENWSRRIRDGTPLKPLLDPSLKIDYGEQSEQNVWYLIKFFRHGVVHMCKGKWKHLTQKEVIQSLEIVFPGFMADLQFRMARNQFLKFVMKHQV